MDKKKGLLPILLCAGLIVACIVMIIVIFTRSGKGKEDTSSVQTSVETSTDTEPSGGPDAQNEPSDKNTDDSSSTKDPAESNDAAGSTAAQNDPAGNTDTSDSAAPEKQEQPAFSDPSGIADATDEAPLSLFEFCNDPSLYEWAESFQDAVPEKMTAIMLGEGPVYMEFTDPELILATAEAISTVKIGGLSSENPDNVADAGGWAYYFKKKGSRDVSFSFVLNTFNWNGSAYHNINSWGDLPEVNEVLLKIGNPQTQYIYAEDDGFYTKYLETWDTDWKEEVGVSGGILIYPDPDSDDTYVSIGRVSAEETDANHFLTTTLKEYLMSTAEEDGMTVQSGGTVVNYAVGKKEYPAMMYTIRDENGNATEMLNVVRTEKEDLTGDICLIRFCAAYGTDSPTEQKNAMKALDMALKEFYFHYRAYQKQEVQPGSTLVEFCNDARLTRWFDEFENHLPRELVYTSDRWHVISDPDAIYAVTEALKTVTIGDVSSKHVGGSGRQIFDYEYDYGDGQSFMFFQDTFDWDGESYDVLDWGDLDDIDILALAEE